jgi:hypothetical protein
MKLLDNILRTWRVRLALRSAPADPVAVFDIGCDDGHLLRQIRGENVRRDGCDPVVRTGPISPGDVVLKGFFPDAAPTVEQRPPGGYDAIFALAVFEHFTAEDLQRCSPVVADMLAADGRLIVTVPHPFVDKILHVLMFLRLIDGQEAHQHHGFDPRTLANELHELRLVRRRRFQLGLNYLFVFARR